MGGPIYPMGKTGGQFRIYQIWDLQVATQSNSWSVGRSSGNSLDWSYKHAFHFCKRETFNNIIWIRHLVIIFKGTQILRNLIDQTHVKWHLYKSLIEALFVNHLNSHWYGTGWLPRWQEFTWKCKRCSFDPWVGRSPGGGNDNPLQYSWPGEFHGQRSLVGYSPWARKELNTTEHVRAGTHTRSSLSVITTTRMFMY